MQSLYIEIMKKLVKIACMATVLWCTIHECPPHAQTLSPGQGIAQPFVSVRAEARLDSVTIAGVGTETMSALRSFILSAAGGVLNEGLIDHDRNAIAMYLREQGWWNALVTAVVDSSGGGSAALTFSIVTGPQVKFGGITVEASPPVQPGGDSGIHTMLELPDLYGKPFTKDTIESVAQKIVTLYSANGYPHADVLPVMQANSDTVAVTLAIRPGVRAHIDSIVVRGLIRTKDYVVLRELDHIRGMPAGPDAVNRTLDVVRGLRFLQAASSPSIDYTSDGAGILMLDLEEKGAGSFDGVVGYQPADSGESGELIGTVHLDLVNMFGTGRSSNIRWEKLSGQSQDLEFSYSEPRIFKLPYSISGAFLQEERERNGYTRTGFDLKIGRHIGRLSFDGGYRYEKVSADSLTSSDASGFNIGAAWNGTDDSINPRSGIYYATSWSLLSKNYRFGSKDGASMDHLEVDLDHFVPTLKLQTLAILIRYRRVQTDLSTIDPSDRYWLGGSTSIRGYRERLFPAVKALWSSFEYRFLTGGPSRFFVFVDTGYLIDYERTLDGPFRKKTLNPTGYGFGIRLQSRAGTLGFDYGLGKGDSLGQGKLHMRLSTEF